LKDLVVGCFHASEAVVVGADEANDGGREVALRVHASRVREGDDAGYVSLDEVQADFVVEIVVDAHVGGTRGADPGAEIDGSIFRRVASCWEALSATESSFQARGFT
jgi:hypothetical protein